MKTSQYIKKIQFIHQHKKKEKDEIHHIENNKFILIPMIKMTKILQYKPRNNWLKSWHQWNYIHFNELLEFMIVFSLEKKKLRYKGISFRYFSLPNN